MAVAAWVVMCSAHISSGLGLSTHIHTAGWSILCNSQYEPQP